MRSRWAMLLAPAAFMAVYELGRVGTAGPTVDAINLSNTYGIIAFVVGRGFTGLLTVLPMLIGAVYGAALARRLSRLTEQAQSRETTHPVWRGTRRVVAAVTAVAVIALAVLIARPAGTDPILTADGNPAPSSVAELTQVPIGGHQQTIMMRGANVDAPVLLFLAGGPGGTEIGSMPLFDAALEQDFVVAIWDQRGTGKSYPALDPTSTLTLDQTVRDTIEVTDQLFYADTVAYAQSTGNTALADTLQQVGPPPYTNLLDYVPGVFTGEPLWNDYSGSSHATEMPANLFVREYLLVDQVHALGGTMDTFAVLYPQLQSIDFRVDVPALQVPVYLVQGRYEARGRAVLADEWFAELLAPTKQMIVFPNSGHRSMFEDPARFHDTMTGTVLTQTYPQ